MEEPSHGYDHEKFVNNGAVKNFGLISKNRSFIKEKGFHHPDDFFRKTIANKGWRALCQPTRPTTTMVVREFYTNLAAHVLKKVRVRGMLVDFSVKSINEFYYLEPINIGAYDSLSTTLRSLDCLPMAKGSAKLTMKGMSCTSRPNIWPTSLRYGITSSHPTSFPQLMCVK